MSLNIGNRTYHPAAEETGVGGNGESIGAQDERKPSLYERIKKILEDSQEGHINYGRQRAMFTLKPWFRPRSDAP